MENAFQSQWRSFVQLISNPEGITGLVGLMVLLICLLFSHRLKWVVMAVMLWASTLNFQVILGQETAVQLVWPLNVFSTQGRPITGALLLSLALPPLLAPRGGRQRLVGAPVLLLFILEILLAFRITAGGIRDRGILSFILYTPI